MNPLRSMRRHSGQKGDETSKPVEFLKIYDGLCVMMGFPYELLVLVKRSPGPEWSLGDCD